MTNDVLDLTNELQYELEITLTLDDNGDWEYTRCGFGEDDNGLYLVDLNDTGENLREKTRINSSLSLMDVLYEGVDRNIFVEDEDGTFWVNADNDDWNAWDEFVKWMQ